MAHDASHGCLMLMLPEPRGEDTKPGKAWREHERTTYHVSTSSAPDEESEMEIAEAQVDNDIEAAQELERRRQQQVADSAKLVEVMASLKESAAQRLAQENSENREGSRTPRRQKQGPIDLTKDKEEKPTNAGQPPLPAQQPQPPAKKPPPGGASV